MEAYPGGGIISEVNAKNIIHADIYIVSKRHVITVKLFNLKEIRTFEGGNVHFKCFPKLSFMTDLPYCGILPKNVQPEKYLLCFVSVCIICRVKYINNCWDKVHIY